jgi:hypothetical protein
VNGNPVKHRTCHSILFWINLPGGGVVFWCPSCRCDLDPRRDDADIYIATSPTAERYYVWSAE